MAQVSVDTDGLHSAGTGLANTAGPGGVAPRCDPAATDPVSVSVAETLTQWSQVLWTLMEHAGQQREAGGMSLARTAEYLGSLDDAGAGRIASVLGSSPSTAAPESLPPATPGAVPAPTLPHLPQIPSPPPMTGDQVAALVHAQPDPARLREFANRWRTQIAPHILSAADHTRRFGNSVAQAWDSGTAPVSDNLLQHADWLESSLYSSALQLAQAAEQAAGHAETVIQSTPTPQEFHEVHARLQTAVKHYQVSGDPTEAIALTQHLREKRTTAVAGYQTYAAAAPTTTGAAANPPVPAPPIVRGTGPGDSSETNANQLNPGAHCDHAGDGNDAGKGAGDDTQRPSTADIGPPLGQSGTPPIAPAQQQPVTTSPATAGAPVMADIAGEVMGAGLGTAGQLANSMHGVSGSPLSALSGLASPSGLGGMPHMGGPQAPSGGDGPEAESMPDLENDHDYGSGGTTPAGGGGGGDGGGGAPVSPPVSGTVSAANPTVGPPVGTSPSGGVPTAAGGSGMIAPPMMGGMGRGNEDERKAAEKRRVVLRPVVNSEPVFGAAERQRSTQRRRKEDSQ
ncbi:hypothetical protein [Mycobacterium riyadhense]|uniref:hypothetical protein n=1 Tax=Mycobacterium riyadhense TaxID=486698 RepID=UPI0019503BF1|nr:hypothetical protein [Mycobacterium riyadhense]